MARSSQIPRKSSTESEETGKKLIVLYHYTPKADITCGLDFIRKHSALMRLVQGQGRAICRIEKSLMNGLSLAV